MTSLVDLECAFIDYVHTALETDQLKEVYQMGLSLSQIRLLLKTHPRRTRAELKDSVCLSPLLKRIFLDESACESLLQQQATQRARQSLIDTLLLAGATHTMLEWLFGWSRQRVANRRALLGICISSGRKKKDNFSARVKAELNAAVNDQRMNLKSAERFKHEGFCLALISVARDNDLGVHQLWRLTPQMS